MSDELAILREENARLRDEIAHLKGQLAPAVSLYAGLSLTSSENTILGALAAHDWRSKQQLMDVLYGHKPSTDEAEIKIVDVFICKLRAKLKPYGVAIETIWGQGYRLPPPSKARLTEMCR